MGPEFADVDAAVMSRILLGTSELLSGHSTLDLRSAGEFLLRAYDLGITAFDTAPMYAQGLAESMLGETVANKPGVKIVTKVGRHPTRLGVTLQRARLQRRPLGLSSARTYSISGPDNRRSPSWPLRSSAAILGAVRRALIDVDFSKRAIEQSIVNSCRRLRLETLEVVVLHSPPQESVLMDSLEALEGMVERGVVNEIGVSIHEFHQVGLLENLSSSLRGCNRHLLAPVARAEEIVQQLNALKAKGWRTYGAQPFATYSADVSSRAQHIRSLLARGFDYVVFGTTNVEHLRENISS